MQGEDTDPLTVVVNLFDVSMVFAVSLMVAMVMNMNMTEVFTQEDFSVVKNPGKENMEIITKKGGKIERYTPSNEKTDKSSSRGRRVGVAYEMEDGPSLLQSPRTPYLLSRSSFIYPHICRRPSSC